MTQVVAAPPRVGHFTQGEDHQRMELLERSPHLSELQRLLRLAEAGHGSLVLLGGEAGIGKSALVRRFRAAVPAATRVVVGYCDPLSIPRPLGPLWDIAAGLGGSSVLRASSAVPRHRLFSAFLAELDREQAPVVVIEDAHWADESSLDLIRFVGRRAGSVRSLVIVTFRSDEVGPTHPLQCALGDLATAPDAHRLDLSPLSLAAVRSLAKEGDLDPVALHRQTGGNPFFVTEVLAAGTVGIPATVRDAVLARAARLADAARTTLDAAAVIGSPIEPWLLARVCDATLEAVEACMAGGMLRAEGDALAFRHELAREAVLGAIAPPRRIALHARVLAALLIAGKPDPARAAYHAEAANDGKAVLDFAPRAAERAAAARAHREAAAHFARALRFAADEPLERRGALLEAHAHESCLTDRLAEGIASGEAALDIWRQTADRPREGASLRRLSRLYWLAGRREDAERAGWDAVSVLELLPPGPHLAMAYSNISQLFLLAWDAAEAIAWGQKAIALAELLGETETLVHALHNVGMARQGPGEEDGTALVEQSLRLALEADLEDHAARAFGNFGLSQVVAYRFAEADRLLTEGMAYCTERDLDQQRLYMLAWYALSLFQQGRWPESSASAAEVIRQPRVSPTSRIMALVALGRVGVRGGDAGAVSVLNDALSLATQSAELQRLGPVRVARAEAAWLAGDHARVVAEAKEMLDLVIRHKHGWLVGELAFWLWRAGDLTAAPPGALEPFALQIEGHGAPAAVLWRALGCPYEAAWALADGGDEHSLREAHAEFTRMGAVPAAALVAQRLQELGARGIPRGPRPTTQANPAHLTPRQMEVLALLAQGLPNAEIANRLFLSSRTVAHHVSAILAKLGVHSRAEAVKEAARLGIASQIGHLTAPK